MPHVRHRDTHPCASRGQRQSSDGSTSSRAHEDRRLPAGPVLLVLAVALALSVVLSLAFSTIRLPVEQAWHVLDVHVRGGAVEATADQIVWGLRLPRTVLAVVAGAGLSVGGAVMQTLVRNPLADPYMLGVSAGASVGATAVITTGTLAAFGVYSLYLGALLGALVATAAVFGIAMAQGGLSPLRLVLTGVVMSSAFSAMSSFLVFHSNDPKSAQSVLFWLLGSVAGASWQTLVPTAVVVLVTLLLLMIGSRWLDALAAGPELASSLGVPVTGLRVALFIVQAILVSAIVAVSGGIGFVGLVIPHLTRLLVGPRHRVVLPVSALFGALFLVWVDVLSRVASRPQETPLRIVTGLLGAPVFLLLLGRRHYQYAGA